MVDQEKIHNQCLSNDPKERRHALEKLYNFSSMPDKQQAWDDLHRLTSDENSDVRSSAVEALCSVLSQVPDKQQAWNDLLRLIIGQDPYFKACIAHYIGSIYSDMPSKQQAWNDLIRLLSDQDHDVREWAGIALDYVLRQAFEKAMEIEPDKNRRDCSARHLRSARNRTSERDQGSNVEQ